MCSIEVANQNLAFKPDLLGCEISEVQFRKRTESDLHYKRVSLCGNWIFIQSPIEVTLWENSSFKIKMLSQQLFVIANRGLWWHTGWQPSSQSSIESFPKKHQQGDMSSSVSICETSWGPNRFLQQVVFRRLGDVSKCKIQIVYWSVCIWVWTCKGGLGVSRDVNGHPWRSFFCHICRDFQLKDFQILSTKFTSQAQILNNFEFLFDWFCEIMMFDYVSYL